MNQERNDTDPEGILRLKDELLERFSGLPAEHQATMALVIVQTVRKGEWEEWLQGALEESGPLPKGTGDNIFSITGISREDLEQVGFSAQDIERLTDRDMLTIAQAMADHYVADIFWDELKFHTQEVLNDKGIVNIK